MWAVANGKISVLLLTSWYILKFYSSIEFTLSNLIRLYLIEKDHWGANGKRLERSDW